MRKATTLFLAGALTAISAVAFAQTNDGTRDGSYGAPLAGQETQTQFGDASISLIDFANGSELDNLYAKILNGRLYIFIGGNLESNFNKLELFIDTKAGGQNTLVDTNPDIDFNGLNRLKGLTFDAGFSPDYYITATGGFDGSSYRMFANYAELNTGGGGAGYFLGSNLAATPGPLGGGTNPNAIEITINNANSAGVSGGCGLSDGSAVTTGIELQIPLTALGNPPGGCIKLSAFVNGSGHDFLSNQVMPSLPSGTCNLGEPFFVNFENIAGLQYATICNAPVAAKKSTWGGVKSMYR